MEELKWAVDYSTFGVLGIMSVIAFAYGIERFFYYRNAQIEHFQTKNEAEAELTKNLTAISIIGSNVPYVGLLGTNRSKSEMFTLDQRINLFIHYRRAWYAISVRSFLPAKWTCPQSI